MKQVGKRLLSLLLALCMMMSLCVQEIGGPDGETSGRNL